MEPLQPSLLAPEESSLPELQVHPMPSRAATTVEEPTGMQELRGRRPQRQKSPPCWMVDYE
jgi:hypothetical protein